MATEKEWVEYAAKCKRTGQDYEETQEEKDEFASLRKEQLRQKSNMRKSAPITHSAR